MKIPLSILLLFCVASLRAQETPGSEVAREVEIDSVVVTGQRTHRTQEVSVGTRVTPISMQVLEGNQTRSLSELLSNNTMVYVKSTGQGALATSSFRGTSPSHTQVNWNGININPNMSSTFDFSQIPVFFADNVTLYHGNSYIKGGTGALGGSINIGNTADWNDTTRVRAFAEYGSWNTWTGAASVRIVRPKALYQTRLYYQQSDNDYRYLNKVFAVEPFYERRQEAQYKQAGVMQEAYFRPGKYSTISNNLWLQYNDRHLPQPVVVNRSQHETQDMLDLKYMFEYRYERDRHEVSAKAGYLMDRMEYRRWTTGSYQSDERSLNRSHTLALIGDYTYTPASRWTLNGSVRYRYDRVEANSYANERTDRHVASLQAGAMWKNSWLSLTGQVMGELNDTEAAPTFSVGAAAELAEKLTLKANISYNYKFPSLNDLYWQPGGNPDLKPEEGFSYDLSLRYTPKIGEYFYFYGEVTGYVMNIDNWIMWLPSDHWYWEPRNVHNVLSAGAEVLTSLTWRYLDWRVKLGVNYTYSRSMNRERNFAEDNTYHKQLPYVPLHKANARLRVDYKNLFFTYLVNYTGERYTSADEAYSTNAYTIHDLELGYDIKLRKRYKLTPKLRVDNLFDTYYESTQFYPMPLRSILGSIMFTF